jgi:hypothetical protein
MVEKETFEDYVERLLRQEREMDKMVEEYEEQSEEVEKLMEDYLSTEFKCSNDDKKGEQLRQDLRRACHDEPVLYFDEDDQVPKSVRLFFIYEGIPRVFPSSVPYNDAFEIYGVIEEDFKIKVTPIFSERWANNCGGYDSDIVEETLKNNISLAKKWFEALCIELGLRRDYYALK